MLLWHGNGMKQIAAIRMHLRIRTKFMMMLWVSYIVCAMWPSFQKVLLSHAGIACPFVRRQWPLDSIIIATVTIIIGGWRKAEFQWMSVALVGDSNGIWPHCTNYPTQNALSLHSSSFTAIPSHSPVWEGHDWWYGVIRVYGEVVGGKSANWGSPEKMAVKLACVCVIIINSIVIVVVWL